MRTRASARLSTSRAGSRSPLFGIYRSYSMVQPACEMQRTILLVARQLES